MTKQLFLRTTEAQGRSYNGFQWPLEVGATVTAPDWSPVAECGHGLHGLLDGLGNASHLSFNEDAIWWIVEAEGAIDLCGKHKFKSCKVIAFGPRHEITAKLHDMRPGPIHGVCLTGGDHATLTGGYRAKLTGGDHAKLTGGDGAKLTGGDHAKLTGGDGATLTGGNCATLTGGDEAKLTGGNCATLTGGDGATLTGGDGATLTGGNCATLTGGDEAKLTGGDGATMIFLRLLDGRRRVLTAYVGENGIKPGVAYRANDDHTAVVEVA